MMNGIILGYLILESWKAIIFEYGVVSCIQGFMFNFMKYENCGQLSLKYDIR